MDHVSVGNTLKNKAVRAPPEFRVDYKMNRARASSRQEAGRFGPGCTRYSTLYMRVREGCACMYLSECGQ